MLYSFQSGIIQRAKLLLACGVVSGGMALAGQFGQAQPLVPPIPQAIDWISGPASNSLTSIASIKIPQGYKFADEQGARIFLERMTNAVPKGLVGILCPEAEGWWIALVFAETGYVKDDQKGGLDADAILKNLRVQVEGKNAERAKRGLPPVSGLDWELKPLYDTADHTLEWAVRLQNQPQAVVSHTVRLLGRQGAVDAIVVRPYKGFSDLTPLRQLVKGISFKAGQAYADYQSADKVSALGLAAMITADNSAKEAISVAAAPSPRAGAWADDPRFIIGGGVLGCVALVGGIVLLARRYRRLTSVAEKEQRGHTAAPIEARPPGNGAGKVVLAVAADPAPKRVNGKHNGARRKKMFDYNRYFSDLNSAVSGHLSQMEAGGVNGYTSEADRLPRAPSVSDSATSAQSPLSDEHSDFIASQRALMEEQKRLIHEQSKLIEEKTKLIAEKNQLLKMQSEMIDSKLL